MPYAWQHNRVKKLRITHPAVDTAPNYLPLESTKHVRACPCLGGHGNSEVMWKDCYLQHEDLAGLSRSQDVFRKIEVDPYLSMNLPKPKATAGAVLRHCVQVFERLLEKFKPMTFKFGITHDAHVRWWNPKFGYKHSKDKFEHMLVLFGASNPHGPAFLEAALIEKYGSALLVCHEGFLFWFPP